MLHDSWMRSVILFFFFVVLMAWHTMTVETLLCLDDLFLEIKNKIVLFHYLSLIFIHALQTSLHFGDYCIGQIDGIVAI